MTSKGQILIPRPIREQAGLSPNGRYASSGPVIETLSRMFMQVMPLGAEPAFLAGKAFGRYRSRRAGNDVVTMSPDFFIGAHAQMLGMRLLTRDPAL